MTTHPELPALGGPTILPASGGKPKQLILFMHGVGADGNDLISLADELAPSFPEAQFISPNAPFPCDMAPMGYQWFSLLDRSPDKLLEGARQAEPIVNQFIDHALNELELHDSQLAIIGFSQGTMTSLHTMMRRSKPCAALVGFSGALLAPDLLEAEIQSRPPVCLIHGEADMVVPFGAMELAEEALTQNAVPHETHARPNLGHGIDGEGLEAAVKFLQQHLL